MEKSAAETYLQSLLNKSLRITTTDTRMFRGQFRCTDSDRNIILSQTFEYRFPPPPPPSALIDSSPTNPIVIDMTSRFLGLVVVPGQYITKIEVEEFESQVRRIGRKADVHVETGLTGEERGDSDVARGTSKGMD